MCLYVERTCKANEALRHVQNTTCGVYSGTKAIRVVLTPTESKKEQGIWILELLELLQTLDGLSLIGA